MPYLYQVQVRHPPGRSAKMVGHNRHERKALPWLPSR
jgi:hypothetical protein